MILRTPEAACCLLVCPFVSIHESGIRAETIRNLPCARCFYVYFLHGNIGFCKGCLFCPKVNVVGSLFAAPSGVKHPTFYCVNLYAHKEFVGFIAVVLLHAAYFVLLVLTFFGNGTRNVFAPPFSRFLHGVGSAPVLRK